MSDLNVLVIDLDKCNVQYFGHKIIPDISKSLCMSFVMDSIACVTSDSIYSNYRTIRILFS